MSIQVVNKLGDRVIREGGIYHDDDRAILEDGESIAVPFLMMDNATRPAPATSPDPLQAGREAAAGVHAAMQHINGQAWKSPQGHEWDRIYEAELAANGGDARAARAAAHQAEFNKQRGAR